MPVQTGFVELRTARLVVRRFDLDDVATFAAYRSDHEVARYQSWDSYTLERAERFIRDMGSADPGVPGEWFQFAVADASSDQLVGDVALRVDGRNVTRAEMGFTFAPGSQGKGYATVYAIADARNHRSIALLERIGMDRVSTERALFKGEWCEEHTYELRREQP